MTSRTSSIAPPPNCRGDGPAGGSLPRRRPNSSPSRRLKLRHSSSRSGGPWLPPPWPCGPREPPRPQLGSFNDMDDSVRLKGLRLRGARVPRRRALEREFGDRTAQLVQAGAGAGAHENARNPTILIALGAALEPGEIDLVADHELRQRFRPDFLQDLVHLALLRVPYRRGGVYHVQQEVGVHRFLQGGAKRGHQPMGQVADEADGVRQHHVTYPFQPDAARGGVEGGEQLVRLVRLGVRERVEQRRLAGIGVADERDRQHLAAYAAAPLNLPLSFQRMKLFLEHLDAAGDISPVELQLFLAR